MQIESNSLRTSVVAKRIALLAVVALALGLATFFLARSSVEQAPIAELSFNPDAAYYDDFALTLTGHPAIAEAQSILSDAVILDLLNRGVASANSSLADHPTAISDFRSRLDLAEPALETLQVRYRDPNPHRAAIVANAVATALAEASPPEPAPRQGKASPKAKKPAWENPFEVMRLASVPPHILAKPIALAAGIAVSFFAAGIFGGFLFWYRALQAAHIGDAEPEAGAFTLVPPMPVAPQAFAQAAVAPSLKPPRDDSPSEFEDVWQPVAREPEDWDDADQTVSEIEPALAAAEPEEEWEEVAREPEELWETEEPAPSAASEPIPQQIPPARVAQEEKIVARTEPVLPALPTPALEIVPNAPGADFHREIDTAKLLELLRSQTPPKPAPQVAPKPPAESANVAEPPVSPEDAGELEEIEQPEEIAGGYVSRLDPGSGDSGWSERILQGFARTSMGQMLDAGQRRDAPDSKPRVPYASTADDPEEREPRESESA